MTITSIGYGDITPVSQLEYGISVISQLLGAVLWAAAVSQLAGIFANLDPHETAWKQNMDALNYFLRDRNCDPLLSRRVREFLIASKHTQRRQRESGILLLMSPALQGEVAQQSHHALLNGISYFRDASADFILQISLAVQTRCFAPREMVFSPHLNVVYTGLAAVRGVIKMRSQVWNEDFIVCNTSLRRGGPACALTFLEVFQLERDLLFDLLEGAAFAQERYRVKRAAVLLALRRWLVINHAALKSKSNRQSPVAFSTARGDAEESGDTAQASPASRPPSLSVPGSGSEAGEAAAGELAMGAGELSAGEWGAQGRLSRGGEGSGGGACSNCTRLTASLPLRSMKETPGASAQAQETVARQKIFGSKRGGSGRVAFGPKRSQSVEAYWGDTLNNQLNISPQYGPLDGSVSLNSRTAIPSPMPSPSGGLALGRHEARQEARLMQLNAKVAELARQQARMLSMLEIVTASRVTPHSSPHDTVMAAEESQLSPEVVRAEVRAMFNAAK